MGPSQPPAQWVPGGFSPGAKRPRRDADHSPPYNANVMRTCSYNIKLQHPVALCISDFTFHFFCRLVCNNRRCTKTAEKWKTKSHSRVCSYVVMFYEA
jgi:hypothetical protein